MPIFKCKMCGGQLNIADDCKIVECEYCGSTQTLPSFDNEKKSNLFNRANNLRLNKEFDKAAGVYESIVAEFPDEAEAYWGLCLCKFGIEYVDDPTTGKKVPTCHRTCTTSIMNDNDFELTSENADIVSKKVYREEAKAIDCIQKRILEVVAKEEPYDVFICYKETDDVTKLRTEDSSIAQDIYTELVKEGYRVFFSRVTLREKAGTEYEPYIYAALTSAKVMLAIGTKFEYYDAVWVKNEWSRFIRMINDTNGKILIPCYRDIDAYDMPKEFKNMQALDMGEMTFFRSLLKNITEIISSFENNKITSAIHSTSALTKRGYLFLEDGDFKSADAYFEKALDENPEDSKAYIGKILVALRMKDIKEIDNVFVYLHGNKNFERAIRFATGNEKEYLEQVKENADKKCLVKQLSVGLNQLYNKLKVRESRKKVQINQGYISIGYDQTIGLRKTGSVISTDFIDRDVLKYLGECNVYKWTDIIKVVAGYQFVVGLKKNGTVIATGRNNCNQCNVDDWSDIIDIAAGFQHTVGVKSNGTVVATRYDDRDYSGECEVSEWKNIVAISAGATHTVGLKADGTVVATKHLGGLNHGQCDVSDWESIVAIASGFSHTLGLKEDGTVVSTKYKDSGLNIYNGQCDVSNWENIVAIAAGATHSVGLKSDGTVVATKHLRKTFYSGQCDVSDWNDIVAIAADGDRTVALKNNGAILYTTPPAWNHSEIYSYKDVYRWNLFDTSSNSPMDELQLTLKQKEVRLVEQKELEEKNLIEKEAEKKREEKLQQMRAEEERAKKVQLQKEMEQKRIIEKRRSQGLCLHCGGTFKGFFSKKCSQCSKKKDY